MRPMEGGATPGTIDEGSVRRVLRGERYVWQVHARHPGRQAGRGVPASRCCGGSYVELQCRAGAAGRGGAGSRWEGAAGEALVRARPFVGRRPWDRRAPIDRREGRDHLFAFAGLWESWNKDGEIRSCTILTTQADDLVGGIHEQMPVIL